jgi:hypothetical protein
MVKLEIYAADPYKPVIVKWFNKNDIVKLQWNISWVSQTVYKIMLLIVFTKQILNNGVLLKWKTII